LSLYIIIIIILITTLNSVRWTQATLPGFRNAAFTAEQ
jgi:hypothetical protein